MIASDELQALIAQWRTPVRKAKLFDRKSKKAGNRLDAARRLAELATSVPADEALIDALQRASSEFTDDRAVRRAYARALAESGRVAEAIGEFEERLQTNADDAEDLLDVAELYERAGRRDLAADRLRRSVDLCVAANDLDAAVSAARRLIVLEPQSLENAQDLIEILRARDPALLAEGVEHLADVYRERGKLGQEASACRELLALEPARKDVRDRLSSIYTRIVEVDPDDQDAWFGLAAIDAPLAEQLRVLLDSESPPASDSTSGAGTFSNGAAASANGVTSSANGAAAPTENHGTYANRKAQELMDAGDIVGASLCLERAVQTDSDPQSHLRLGLCYLALHRDVAAAREGIRALALAQTKRQEAAAEEALSWLTSIAPAAGDSLADAVFLNHRPESADKLYEELLQLWEAATNGTHGGGAAGGAR